MGKLFKNTVKVVSLVLLLTIFISIYSMKRDFDTNEDLLRNQIYPLTTLRESVSNIITIHGIDISMGGFTEDTHISKEMAVELAENPIVRASEIAVHMHALSPNLNPIFENTSPFKHHYYFRWEHFENYGSLFTFSIRGILNEVPLIKELELIDISEGRFFEENDFNKIVISYELAAYNSLQVGDTVTLTNTWQIFDFDIEVEIIGLFTRINPFIGEFENFNYFRAEQLINQIYAPFEFVQFIRESNYGTESWYSTLDRLAEFGAESSFYHLLSVNSSFLLYDIQDLSIFQNLVNEISNGIGELIDFSFYYGDISFVFDTTRHQFRIILWIIFTLISLVSLFYFLTKRNKLNKNRNNKESLNIISIIAKYSFYFFLSIAFSRPFVEYVPRKLLRDYYSKYGPPWEPSVNIGDVGNPMLYLNPGVLDISEFLPSYVSRWHIDLLILLFICGILVIITLIIIDKRVTGHNDMS